MSAAINVQPKVRRTAGGGVDSVVSFFGGGAASSFTGTDFDGVGASDVSTTLVSFGTSAFYSTSI